MAARLGQAFLRDTTRMFTWWHRVRAGTGTRGQFQTAMRPLRRRGERRQRRGAGCGHAKTAATGRALLALAPARWTFVDVPDVDPTHNAAGRALRPAVLRRKGCWGTHSAAGSRFVERILTVAATLKQQHRNIVDSVTQACIAALHDDPAPCSSPGFASGCRGRSKSTEWERVQLRLIGARGRVLFGVGGDVDKPVGVALDPEIEPPLLIAELLTHA